MSEADYGAYRPISAPQSQDATRTSEPSPRSEGSPLRSQEAFDAYCLQVQNRLAEYAVQRNHFLRSAYERLTRLLQTARAVEDNTLYNELWQVRVAVRELLESLSQSAPQGAGANWATVQQIQQRPAVSPQAAAPVFTAEISQPRQLAMPVISAPASGLSQIASQPSVFAPRPEDPAARLPRQPMRPLVDIEADAIRMREELKTWIVENPVKRENGELHIPNALRLRAIACRMRRLEEEGGDTEIAEVTELKTDLERIREEGGDEEYTVTLQYDIEPRPTAFQWGELAERHEETARAQEAFEWWVENRERLTVQDVQPLAEAVAAIQQRFNRLLFRINARDPFQQKLFDDLRVWAREAQCYLFSLRPKVPIAELVDKASRLDAAWDQARAPLAAAEGRGQAVEHLVELTEDPCFGENFAEDSEKLAEAVLQTKQAGTPASDPRLRASLLPWSAMLEGDDRFRDTVREIQLDWEGRLRANRLDPAPVDDAESLKEIADLLQEALTVTRNQRVLILGDLKSDAGMARLREVFDCEIIWPPLTTADTLSRFDAAIAGCDMVVLATRFSRKDWHGAENICLQSGKPFVQVPGVFPLKRLATAILATRTAVTA